MSIASLNLRPVRFELLRPIEWSPGRDPTCDPRWAQLEKIGLVWGGDDGMEMARDLLQTVYDLPVLQRWPLLDNRFYSLLFETPATREVLLNEFKDSTTEAFWNDHWYLFFKFNREEYCNKIRSLANRTEVNRELPSLEALVNTYLSTLSRECPILPEDLHGQGYEGGKIFLQKLARTLAVGIVMPEDENFLLHFHRSIAEGSYGRAQKRQWFAEELRLEEQQRLSEQQRQVEQESRARERLRQDRLLHEISASQDEAERQLDQLRAQQEEAMARHMNMEMQTDPAVLFEELRFEREEAERRHLAMAEMTRQAEKRHLATAEMIRQAQQRLRDMEDAQQDTMDRLDLIEQFNQQILSMEGWKLSLHRASFRAQDLEMLAEEGEMLVDEGKRAGARQKTQAKETVLAGKRQKTNDNETVLVGKRLGAIQQLLFDIM